MTRNTAEPSIEEMLADPIVRALMTADRVRADELKGLLRSIAKRLRASASETIEETARTRACEWEL
jgi:hypothetical protein